MIHNTPEVVEQFRQFADMTFDPSKHVYTVDDKNYVSATTLLKKYTPEFQREQIAGNVARKLGWTARMVMDQWTVKMNMASARGSEFHLYVELFFRYNQKLPILYTPLEHQIKEFHNCWNTYQEFFKPVAIELAVYDKEWEVAGTLDCVVQDVRSGHYHIFDWKTNEEIPEFNKYASKLPPLQHLSNAKFYDYALQLSLYKKILMRRTNLPIDKLYLFHFPPNKDFKWIEVPFMEKEIDDIVADYIPKRNNAPHAKDPNYNELLLAVERKFENETRHQTALRYIQEAEKIAGPTKAGF